MNTPSQIPERLHGLDSLRAVMMLLGVVFHAALPYRTLHGHAFKDPANLHIFFDRFTVVIHTFRMPVFFVMAGFLGALIYYNRGSIYMIRNRINRIVWPFLVSLVALFPAIRLCITFRNHAEAGWAAGFDAMQAQLIALNFYPFRTFHLWFLYYLSLITFVVWLLALVIDRFPAIKKAVKESFLKVLQPVWFRPVFFSLFTFIVFYFMESSYLKTPSDFKFMGPVFVMYLKFYLFGWLLFKVKDVLPSFMRYDWVQVIIGTVLTLAHIMAVTHQVMNELQMIIKALSTWFFIFGITGLFLRYFSVHSEKMRYMAEASYWIYLVHLPVEILFHGVMAPLPVSVFLKFSLVVTLTFAVCLVSYHYFVRSTMVGKFLNGKVSAVRKVTSKY